MLTLCSTVPVEQAYSIFYILQDYSSLTLVERRGGWVLEVIVVVREQETDDIYVRADLNQPDTRQRTRGLDGLAG